MTRNIFKNDQLQKQFDEKGFVKLSMLEKEEVENLRNYYIDQEFDNKIEAGFHISLDNQNEDLVKEVGSKIKDVLAPKTTALLKDCQIFYCELRNQRTRFTKYCSSTSGLDVCRRK